MAFIDELRRQIAAETAAGARVSEAFAADMHTVLRQLTRRVTRLLGTLETDGPRLRASQAAILRAVRLRAQVDAALDAAGMGDLVTAATTDPLTGLAEQVLRGRALIPAGRRATIQLSTIEALQAVQQLDLLDLGTALGRETWRAVLDGVISGRETADLVSDLAEQIQDTERAARTLYDTGVSTYIRQLHQVGIQPEPEDRFLYVGPVDLATRPFCRTYAGTVQTRAQLSELSNGQLPNTLVTGGGYNCRHQWMFIGEADAASLEAAA